ncbi:MAG: hypothetical protein ACLPV8_23470 [Steroidobacteraceae bacterium]
MRKIRVALCALLLAPLLSSIALGSGAADPFVHPAELEPDVPVWLVAEYNPDVDFNDVRPGTTIALPRVEAINRQ